MIERPMPDRRETVRQRVTIAGRKIYVDVGLYEDGSPGELFIVLQKTGAEQRWLYDEIARLSSKLLQHGCPLEHVAEGWLGTRGTIAGPVVGHERIKNATSVLDFTARMLLVDYCKRDDLAHVTPERS